MHRSLSTRKPDFILSVLDEATGNRNKAGAAWITYDDTGGIKHINLRLSAGVSLSWNDGLLKTFFVNNESPNLDQVSVPPDSGLSDYDVSVLDQMLNESNVSPWSMSFIDNIIKKHEHGKKLTALQLKSAKKIIYEYLHNNNM